MSTPGTAPVPEPAPAPPLVTLTGDGTLRAPAEGSAAVEDAAGDPRLAALLRLRSLLGDPPEDQIGARLYLPAALGTEPADQLLPASLALLSGTSGDLASYGWRIGTGSGRAWQRARELGARTLEAARIALLGYEGPLALTALGPLTLAASTFLGSGERTLADRGALRDLPHLLAEGIAEQQRAVRERVPGARPELLVREDHALPVLRGAVRVPSGYRTYPALPWPELVPLWRTLQEALAAPEGEDGSVLTLAIPAVTDLLRAARDAGLQRIAVPLGAIGSIRERQGRVLWEALAETRESGVDLGLLVDPARLEPELDLLAVSWGELGYGPTDLRGLTLLAHRAPRRREETDRPGEDVDPAAEPRRATLLTEADLERLLRAAPAWAERIGG